MVSTAPAVGYDATLILEPEMVRMDVVPGATRTTALKIENPGDDPVTVRMSAKTPRALGAVELGELKGAELSAEPWTEIRPSEFTIRPGGRKNVRVLSRVPRDGVLHPNYYADLVLEGSYDDGQSAGETRSTVHLFNAGLESRIAGVIDRLSLAQSDDPSEYVAQVRFANHGTIHVDPTARVFVVSPQGNEVRSAPLTGEEGPLLPLGHRTYSADLSFSGLEPGYYALRTRVILDSEHSVTRQQVLLVEATEHENADGEVVSVPRITMVDLDAEDVPEGVDAPLKEAPVFTIEEHGAAGPDLGSDDAGAASVASQDR